ncbi:MAG: sulfatase, partial [Lachnospiraceae bacterium]|nr:sulfatase [Lachnospiraceae bacterium]
PYNEDTLLFDIEEDYEQEKPLQDKELEEHCLEQMKRCMKLHDAPPEQYERLGI